MMEVLTAMRKPRILDTNDDPLEIDEEFDEIKEITQFTREEGHIYESIEDELEAVVLSEVGDLLDFDPAD